MTLMLLIGLPLFLVFGGALLAFGFAHQREPEVQATVHQASEPPSPEHRPLVFFQPVGWTNRMREASVEEIVTSIEAHLRQEHQAVGEKLAYLKETGARA